MDWYIFLLSFFVYGFLGWCTEVAFAAVKEKKFVNRGFLNGPICPIYGVGVCAVIVLLEPFAKNLVVLYISSVIVVTALEWLTGFLLEKMFHNKWWDYSDMRFNLNGYVCLQFSLVWGIGCVAIVKLINPVIQKGISWIPYVLGIVLLAILTAAAAADVYITISGILKWNRRLAKMESIAAELHRISEELGGNIFKGVMETMELQEDISEEMKARTEVLKAKYDGMVEKKSKIQNRLIKAFPKMHSERYKNALEDLKARFKIH